MSFLANIKGFLKGESDEDYEYEEYEEGYEPEDEQEQQEYRPTLTESVDGAKKNKIVSMGAASPLQVVLVKPERFEDASGIANHLNQKKTVVLNLESTNKEISKRLVDFLTGVAYANKAQINRVATNTFIITPYNVDLMGGDALGEMDSEGTFF